MYIETNINRLPLVFMTDSGKNYFQFHINGQLASLEYYMVGELQIDLKRLEICRYLNQADVGNALIERVLEFAQRSDLKVIPTSPEVKAFLKYRPTYQKLVAANLELISDSKGQQNK